MIYGNCIVSPPLTASQMIPIAHHQDPEQTFHIALCSLARLLISLSGVIRYKLSITPARAEQIMPP